MSIQSESVEATLSKMRKKLENVVPDFELRQKAELVYEINRLKAEKGALILGHNYMEPALFHTVPDYVGDSLELARISATTDKDPIIFCGVKFMAETAKILNPTKTVLLPAKEAGCSLAASISAKDVRDLKALFPKAPSMLYVNTYADVKAEVDTCCTSSNAANIYKTLSKDSQQVIFLPDEYLASNVASDCGKSIAVAYRNSNGEIQIDGDKASDIIAWRGRCEVHERFTVSDVEAARKQFDDVAVIAHPECPPEVVAASDFSGSTTRLVKFVKESSAARFMILTECTMGDNIIAENPEKEVIRLCSIRCPHMNQITLEDTLAALRENRYQIDLDDQLRKRAERSVQKMLELS